MEFSIKPAKEAFQAVKHLLANPNCLNLILNFPYDNRAIDRAVGHAGAARIAFRFVDHVGCVRFRDRSTFTKHFAAAALDAFVGNHVSHQFSPPLCSG
jgi:hypothetical protein